MSESKHQSTHAILRARVVELEAALEPFSKEADRWERRGGVVWDDSVPFPANSFSSIKIGDFRVARAALSAKAEQVCSTCDGTGKEGRHSICRDCDEPPLSPPTREEGVRGND